MMMESFATGKNVCQQLYTCAKTDNINYTPTCPYSISRLKLPICLRVSSHMYTRYGLEFMYLSQSHCDCKLICASLPHSFKTP